MKDGIPAEISDGTAVHDKAKVICHKAILVFRYHIFQFFFILQLLYTTVILNIQSMENQIVYEAKVGKATL